jgi:ketosteroid isomerase-like protein
VTDGARDRAAIAEQLARYAQLFDSQDVDGWVALFTDDGVFEVRLVGSDEPFVWLQGVEQLRSFASGSPRVLHHISGLAFDELRPESAKTRAVVAGTWTSPANGTPEIFTHGTYEQRWSKIDDSWRLAHSLFRSYGYSAAMQTPSASPLTV